MLLLPAGKSTVDFALAQLWSRKGLKKASPS